MTTLRSWLGKRVRCVHQSSILKKYIVKLQKMWRRVVGWFYIHSRKYCLRHALRQSKWFKISGEFRFDEHQLKLFLFPVISKSFFPCHLQTTNSVGKATKTSDQSRRCQVKQCDLRQKVSNNFHGQKKSFDNISRSSMVC